MTSEQQQLLSETASALGIERYGWVSLKKPFSFDLYEDWLSKSFHGEMEYLARHSSQKANPQSLLPQASSALVVAFDYGPGSLFEKENGRDFPLENLRVALYARGNDYHIWLTEKLNALVDVLKQAFPNEVFAAYADSSPVLERDLAARAGLGWVGKNTCLIDTKKGSLFFIGEIFSSLKFGLAEDLHADRCGTCTRCIDICPTQAIVEPRKLDARLCLSYLTIEAKRSASNELRPSIGDWFYGCDLCQTVCPWNEKAYGKEQMKAETSNSKETRQGLIREVEWLLKSTDAEIETAFSETPLLRRRAYGLKRNAVLVSANRHLIELRPTLERLKLELASKLKTGSSSSPKNEDLFELCNWALDKLEVPAP